MSALARELGSPWRLQPMESTHIQEVAAIDARAYGFPWPVGVFRDCLRAGYSAWVLRGAGDELLGYGLLSMGAGEAHVLNLCVAPEHQRRGYGRVLLRYLVDLARAAAVKRVLLEVREANHSAIALYRDFGFEHIGVRRGYYPDGGQREDALVFALELE